jgi:hypothetical protein
MRSAALLLALLLTACSGPQLTPEERVRDLLARAEQAAEQRSIGFFSDHLAEGFAAENSGGKRETLRLLRGYFLANQSIHLLVKIETVEVDGSRVHARVYAGMAGSPVQGFEQLLALRAAIYRFDLEFSVGEEPRLLSARWRRADVQDVLPDL